MLESPEIGMTMMAVVVREPTGGSAGRWAVLRGEMRCRAGPSVSPTF